MSLEYRVFLAASVAPVVPGYVGETQARPSSARSANGPDLATNAFLDGRDRRPEHPQAPGHGLPTAFYPDLARLERSLGREPPGGERQEDAGAAGGHHVGGVGGPLPGLDRAPLHPQVVRLPVYAELVHLARPVRLRLEERPQGHRRPRGPHVVALPRLLLNEPRPPPRDRKSVV